MDEFELFKQREANYSSEFEKLAKDYLHTLNNICNGVRKIRLDPSISDPRKNPYCEGSLEIMDSAIESIQAFLDEDNLRKDYPKTFKEMREQYHHMYLGLKKSPKTDCNDGKYRAACDVYKGLNAVIQKAAEYDLNQLHQHQHQQQRSTVRR